MRKALIIVFAGLMVVGFSLNVHGQPPPQEEAVRPPDKGQTASPQKAETQTDKEAKKYVDVICPYCGAINRVPASDPFWTCGFCGSGKLIFKGIPK